MTPDAHAAVVNEEKITSMTTVNCNYHEIQFDLNLSICHL